MSAGTGAEVLDRVHGLLTRYVVLPNAECADAVVLWIAATHAIEAWAHATRLVVRSPEKRCGKSRLLDIVAGLSHDPLMTVNATVAAVFRSLGDRPPTLLVDEADTIFGTKKVAEQNEDFRGLLNAGFQRGRPMLRCVGPNQIPTPFETFAMAALAGIGAMPDTIEDRAVVVTMMRRSPAEPVSPYRARRDGPELADMREGLAYWVGTVLDDLRDAEPEFGLEDRAADTWEPLVAVADAAGGSWPARARTAALRLAEEHDAEAVEASLGVRLLSDLAEVFTTTTIASAELVRLLHEVPDGPWLAFGLDERGLARRVAPYGVRPSRTPRRRGEVQVRGYRRADFDDVFVRYLPSPSGDRPDVSHRHTPTLTCTDAETDQERVTDLPVTRPETVSAFPQVSALRDGVTDRDGHPPVHGCPGPGICRVAGCPNNFTPTGATL